MQVTVKRSGSGVSRDWVAIGYRKGRVRFAIVRALSVLMFVVGAACFGAGAAILQSPVDSAGVAVGGLLLLCVAVCIGVGLVLWSIAVDMREVLEFDIPGHDELQVRVAERVQEELACGDLSEVLASKQRRSVRRATLEATANNIAENERGSTEG